MTNRPTLARGPSVPLGLEDFADDPYPMLKELRSTAPAVWLEKSNVWCVTSYAHVTGILRDPETFRTDSVTLPIGETFGSQMLCSEGATHRRYKTASGSPFNTKAVRDHALAGIRVLCERSVAAMMAAPSAELRLQFATPLAVQTVGAVLGLPASLSPSLREWYDAFAAALANFGSHEEPRVRARLARRAFHDAVGPLIRQSGAADADAASDVFSVFRARGVELTEEEKVSNALIILFGGIETTESALLNTIWALLSDSASYAAVRARPELRAKAIEEALRWEPAVQSCTRLVAVDQTLGDVVFRAGDVVQCMIGGANRDPEKFADPDRFDIERHNAGDHISFGSGKHFCLGAALARVEIDVGLTVLLERFPSIRLDPDRPSRPHGYEFRCPPTLHVLLR